MYVEISTLDGNAKPKLVGQLRVFDGQIVSSPGTPELKRLAKQTIYVLIETTEGTHERWIDPANEPNVWLENLHKELRSPYYRATSLLPDEEGFE